MKEISLLQKNNQEAKRFFDDIDKEILLISYSKPYYNVFEIFMNIECARGGVMFVYYNKKKFEIIKIKVKRYGDTLKGTMQYYFHKKNLIYIKSEIIRYDKLFYAREEFGEDFNVKEVIREKTYFYNGQPIYVADNPLLNNNKTIEEFKYSVLADIEYLKKLLDLIEESDFKHYTSFKVEP